jgi:hypothetical protein
MATLGINVSAFGIATYMIRDENLFFSGILCLFFPVCSWGEMNKFLQGNIYINTFDC